ncbi:MAG: fumarylacetoacetate hydrolase family protein [Candidatus Pelagadaptatus aseana]|uniref:fumarylacetoacetate hydrolase family protein n=1 Tax=Candidatus Pelagadaptatus aseana TaxID=3120508 RepID=UPI0039B29355
MSYQHTMKNGEIVDLPVGKVVCVGRNYAEHAKELNNPVPTEPILFIKPASAVVDMRQPIVIPEDQGSCHIETEMALLIGKELRRDTGPQVLEAIIGVGLGFDLTLRDVQNRLKDKGHPWEKAKAFDGSCPLSPFVSPSGFRWDDVSIELRRNGAVQQQGNSGDMITAVAELLSHIAQHFALQPGDVVLTGTPAGVGPLSAGDELLAVLDDQLSVASEVVARCS